MYLGFWTYLSTHNAIWISPSYIYVDIYTTHMSALGKFITNILPFLWYRRHTREPDLAFFETARQRARYVRPVLDGRDTHNEITKMIYHYISYAGVSIIIYFLNTEANWSSALHQSYYKRFTRTVTLFR